MAADPHESPHTPLLVPPRAEEMTELHIDADEMAPVEAAVDQAPETPATPLKRHVAARRKLLKGGRELHEKIRKHERLTASFIKFRRRREGLLLDDGSIPATHAAFTDGHAKFGTTIVTVVNTIIGGGFLALPFVLSTSGIVPGIMLIVLAGVLAEYAARLVAYTAAYTEGASYKAITELAFGARGGKLVDVLMFVSLMGSCTGYLVILGDIIEPLAALVFDESSQFRVRSTQTFVAVIFVIFPLMMMRSLRSLKYFSIAGMGCATFIIGCIVYRSVSHLLDEGLDDSCAMFTFNPKLFRSVSLLSFAFSFHLAIFPIWREMQDPSVKKLMGAVISSLVICGFTYLTAATFGYMHFCGDIKSNVLNNYADDDALMNTARVALCFIICLSYPLVAFPAKLLIVHFVPDQFITAYIPSNVKNTYLHEAIAVLKATEMRFLVNCAIIALTYILGVAIPDITLVFGLVGASVGNVLIYILPSLSLLMLVPEKGNAHSVKIPILPLPLHVSWRRAPVVLLACIGVVNAIVGTSTSVMGIFGL